MGAHKRSPEQDQSVAVSGNSSSGRGGFFQSGLLGTLVKKNKAKTPQANYPNERMVFHQKIG